MNAVIVGIVTILLKAGEGITPPPLEKTPWIVAEPKDIRFACLNEGIINYNSAIFESHIYDFV